MRLFKLKVEQRRGCSPPDAQTHPSNTFPATVWGSVQVLGDKARAEEVLQVRRSQQPPSDHPTGMAGIPLGSQHLLLLPISGWCIGEAEMGTVLRRAQPNHHHWSYREDTSTTADRPQQLLFKLGSSLLSNRGRHHQHLRLSGAAGHSQAHVKKRPDENPNLCPLRKGALNN